MNICTFFWNTVRYCFRRSMFDPAAFACTTDFHCTITNTSHSTHPLITVYVEFYISCYNLRLPVLHSCKSVQPTLEFDLRFFSFSIICGPSALSGVQINFFPHDNMLATARYVVKEHCFARSRVSHSVHGRFFEVLLALSDYSLALSLSTVRSNLHSLQALRHPSRAGAT